MTLGKFGRRPTSAERRAKARRERQRDRRLTWQDDETEEYEDGGATWADCYACAGDTVERRRCGECHGRGGWREREVA